MKIFGYEFRRASKQEISSVQAYNTSSSFLSSTSQPMLLSTVYRCVDVISDSIAQLPLETYLLDKDGFKRQYKEHPAYSILNEEPNSDMTRFVFFKTLVVSTLLTGNGYAYIVRNDNGVIEELVFINSRSVSIEWIPDSYGIRRKRYRVVGFYDLVEPKDMIHILNFSYDGIIGVSTLTHARQTLQISTDSEAHAEGFFRGGANTAGVLTIEGVRLNKEQKDQNYEEWSARTNPITGNPNGIVILEGNMKYQPITISPKDSQLLESRQFNVIDVCRFFSVSPVKAFDFTNASYSTVEATQLAYLTDTLAPMIAKFEMEIKRKVFLPSEKNRIACEFNTSVLLRTDKQAQSAYLKTMFNIGAISPNEVRKENNLSRLEDGDNTFVQVNVMTLKNSLKVSDKNKVNDKQV